VATTTAPRRIQGEPTYILHSYDWSESSLILEAFTRQHGRVTLLAKGAKKPTSNFRPVLLPLQPLCLAWSVTGRGGGDIHPLKGAEWAGSHVIPTEAALLAGLYLNELLLRLLAREDAHTALFDIYADVVRILASVQQTKDGYSEDALEPVLRAFELCLLREVGLLPALNIETATLTPVEAKMHYALAAEGGLRVVQTAERASLDGRQWLALWQALQHSNAYPLLLNAVGPAATALKPQLRALLQYHCGSPLLRTRQLMMDLQLL